mmetsp:Transcript_22398/g.40398  ORF Transcript_22398/g.40398 Transcript_22398/m.40398 type:complete len:414 (+) Transcript_22398:44-1285(+)|eukprot:CAMPEP_0196143782 /NCGR_PEP_ID=MMETSP0910-20130528/13711_1 /TAXON_ID=49265 /ORGANISM="Thalassiosira rotula, Strain GSO102" /LENGTH=413 /DNA_ID=CAMNT_0041405269 /DNA_START=43 /DNA_END=1284 /DNA_ORIENTATION=+
MKITQTAASFIVASAIPSALAAGDDSTATTLPEIFSLIDIAFPMWEVDADGNRIEMSECTVTSCKWNPFYVTKRYDGLHPDLGGHPSDNDVKYAFFASSPFAGQPYPGTPHHCPMDAPDDIKAGECPKIKTTSDSSEQGPGHVPPHISLAALTWGAEEELFPMEDMFDYDNHECRVVPDVLFKMIRNYFPRTEGEEVDYPPPITPEGGDFQYEFPSGNGLDKQEPPYAAGPPHWCTEEFTASGHWDGVCPYVFEGPDAGKYRHPHIAFAALEVYLANKHMPAECAVTWLENNPDFLDPDRVTTDTPFPVMDADDAANTTVAHWVGQPELPWTYVSGDPRPGALVMSAENSASLISVGDVEVPSGGDDPTPDAEPDTTVGDGDEASPTEESSAISMTGSLAAAIFVAVIGAISM